MTIRKLILASLVIGFALPASAQTVPEDVRCVLLSNLYAKQATDDHGRQLASQTLAFYLGRLDGRANQQALATALRNQAPTIDPKTAGPAMNTCALRLASAEQGIQAAGRTIAPSK